MENPEGGLMRIAKLTWLVCAAMVLTASTAWAGFGLDRPDLADVDSTFVDTAAKTTVANTNFAYIRAEQDTHFAFGYITNSTITTGGDILRVGLSWELFEPDKVSRSETKNNLSQKKWGGIDFFSAYYTPFGDTTGTPSETTASSENCKIKADTKHDKVTGDPTKASWKISCKNALGVDGLDLTTGQATRLGLLLGSAAGKKSPVNIEKDKVKIKGQCADAACEFGPL
jgi:hypothetical protein